MAAINLHNDNIQTYAFRDLTLQDAWSEIAGWQEWVRARAYLEHVHSMPRDGVKSAFAFGRSYGNFEALLTAAGIPFERVGPAVWQRGFGLIKHKGETQTQKKNRHKAKAQELFPGVKVTHAVADCLLIAEWGRRQAR
jgi:hypothetical protein